MILNQTIIAIAAINFLLVYYYTIGFLLNPLFLANKNFCRIRFNENIFLGIISNTLFLYFWNLFLPINKQGFILFILICLLIGMKYGDVNDVRNILRKVNLKILIFFLTTSIWLGFLTNHNIGPYDFGLYHLQVIKWAENFHIIKGIGNLHSRLAFSCSSWLLCSQFNILFNTKLFLWTHGAIYLIIGFINFIYVPLFSNIKKAEKIIRILYVPILFNLCFSSFPGTSSDLPVFLYTSIISLYFFKFVIYKEIHSLNMIFLIAVLGISSKLSFGAIIIGLIIPLIFTLIKMISRIKYVSRGFLFLSLITFVLWSYRNVIMTGYPFYPYSKISFPVAWKMDKLAVENTKNQITIHSTGLTDLEKLNYNKRISWYFKKITVQHRKIEIYYPIIIGIFGLLFSIIFFRKKLFKIFILVLPSVVPIFLWTQIPASRFFYSSFWWLGIMFIVFPLTKILKKFNLNYFYLMIIMFSISIHVFDRLGSPKTFFPINMRSTIPDAHTQKVKSSDGLIYFRPEDGDLCWDSPLPCSPEPKFWLKNIVQTNKYELEEGFRIIKIDK